MLNYFDSSHKSILCSEVTPCKANEVFYTCSLKKTSCILTQTPDFVKGLTNSMSANLQSTQRKHNVNQTNLQQGTQPTEEGASLPDFLTPTSSISCFSSTSIAPDAETQKYLEDSTKMGGLINDTVD